MMKQSNAITITTGIIHTPTIAERGMRINISSNGESKSNPIANKITPILSMILHQRSNPQDEGIPSKMNSKCYS